MRCGIHSRRNPSGSPAPSCSNGSSTTGSDMVAPYCPGAASRPPGTLVLARERDPPEPPGWPVGPRDSVAGAAALMAWVGRQGSDLDAVGDSLDYLGRRVIHGHAVLLL